MSPPSDPLIEFDGNGRVARIRLNRPGQRNAMNADLWRELAAASGRLAGCGARALALSGAGEHFSVGVDRDELVTQLDRPGELLAGAQLAQQVRKLYSGLPLPSVALVRGQCFGAGLGLALCCDLRLATADARFRLDAMDLGLHESLADTRRLAAVIGQARTREMLLAGREIDAETALAWGLVNCVVDDAAALNAAADALCGHWVGSSPAALAATLGVLAAVDDAQASSEDRLDRAFLEAFSGADFREAVGAHQAGRPARFGGAGETADT